MGESIIHVVLASNQSVFRQVIRDALSNVADIILVSETEHSERVSNLVAQLQPEVLILDDQMSGDNVADFVLRLCISEMRVGILLLTSSEDSPFIGPALEAGANGYVLKSSSGDEVVEAVRAVHEANSIRNWMRFNSGKVVGH